MAVRLHNKYASRIAEMTWQLLDKSDLTKAEIADKCGVSFEWLNKFYQRGMRTPAIENVERLYLFLTTSKAA